MNEVEMRLIILLLCFAAPCLSSTYRFSDDSDIRDVPSQYYQQQDRTIDKADFYSLYPQIVRIEGPVLDEGGLPPTIGASLLRHEAASEPTLGSMGGTIVIPGTGPSIELHIEGDLAKKLKNMKMSQLTPPHGKNLWEHLQMHLGHIRWGR